MIKVIGAGLAGCEAAWQIAQRGIPVQLYEMKPETLTPAHRSPQFAELVCSNSLRAARLENAVGLLKSELRRLGSLLIAKADEHAVPAGGALAVDREGFSQAVTEAIRQHPLIEVISTCVTELPEEGLTIVATGPLTQGGLFEEIQKRVGREHLHFFDAAAPIVSKDSLNFDRVFAQSRYGRGGDDYLNCPMDQTEYETFYQALIEAEQAEVEDFDREIVFEGCMPVETMAKRGRDTLRFGPLKPVGLIDPRTGKTPYACVQLRQDDRQGDLYNLVGFQTRLRQGEQKRVFGLIPGLEKAQFLRYGVMHRNTYLYSPGHLNEAYQLKSHPHLYFAGQMTGVEGYVESIASGCVAGIQAALNWAGVPPVIFSPNTVIGAMAAYISDPSHRQFQPMNANWGLLPPLTERVKRHEKTYRLILRAQEALEADLARLIQSGNAPTLFGPLQPDPQAPQRPSKKRKPHENI